MRDHDTSAPIAYPDIHHLISAIRGAARKTGVPDGINLWAGQAHTLAQPAPAAEIVRRLGREAREAVAALARRLEA